MVERTELERYLSDALCVNQFKDYGPNGVQIEGRAQINRLMVGVTASRALIEQALDWQADALLVHHGLFWRGHDGRLTGWLRQRVGLLLGADLNLFAYHLPLDAHPELGNNAALAARLGWRADERLGEQQLVFAGALPHSLTADGLRLHLQSTLERPVSLLPGDGRLLRRVAWCTGGAQGYFEAAIAAGVDAFVTGEMSEPQLHLARETGVAFFACGHHATERYGVQALGAHLAERFGLAWCFCDLDNPA